MAPSIRAISALPTTFTAMQSGDWLVGDRAGVPFRITYQNLSAAFTGNVNITGGSIAGITDLAIADGGTGASTAAGARTNLGLGSLATLNQVPDASITDQQISVPQRMTTANVLAVTAASSAASVGTYVFAYADANVALGSTLAGSSLSPAAAGSQFTFGGGSGGVNANLGGAIPGAWRCMGQLSPITTAPGAATIGFATLWLRVS